MDDSYRSKPRKRRPWKQGVKTRFDHLRWLKGAILDYLYRKRWDEDIFRHFEDDGDVSRKLIEHILQNLLMVDAIEESRKGKYRCFKRVEKP